MKKYNNFSFSKKIRLFHNHDFRTVLKNAVKLDIYEMIVLSKKNNLLYPRLGMVISKKISKYSYQRNYIKRLIRENFRLIQHQLCGIDIIIIPKHNIIHINRLIFVKNLKLLWMLYYK